MSWLTLLRYGAPALVLAALAVLVHDDHTQRAKVAAFKACDQAVATPSADLAACSTAMRDAATAARAAAACDGVLDQGTTPGAFAIQQSCSAQVKRVVAAFQAANSSLTSAQTALTDANKDRDAAVQRAEARVQAANARISANAKTLQAAPRGADGLTHCDAGCLRDLAR